jgi:hypothetical protein
MVGNVPGTGLLVVVGSDDLVDVVEDLVDVAVLKLLDLAVVVFESRPITTRTVATTATIATTMPPMTRGVFERDGLTEYMFGGPPG